MAQKFLKNETLYMKILFTFYVHLIKNNKFSSQIITRKLLHKMKGLFVKIPQIILKLCSKVVLLMSLRFSKSWQVQLIFPKHRNLSHKQKQKQYQEKLLSFFLKKLYLTNNFSIRFFTAYTHLKGF